jgi:16S rRNA (adenine1518-N6/adenine1519-N6)-dimethyltransferase
VRLTPYVELPHPAKSERMLQDVLRTAFSQRRKTLRNNLRTLLDANALTALEIDPGLRPERLTLAEFVRISDYLSSHESEHHGAE